MINDPLVQAAVPSFSKTRARTVVLLRLSVAPAAMTVLPAPCIVPAVQLNVPLAVRSPAPPSVPPDRVSVDESVDAAARLRVPALIVNGEAHVRLLIDWVPLLSVTVVNPLGMTALSAAVGTPVPPV